jgi:lysophospholipase L1-like esterase
MKLSSVHKAIALGAFAALAACGGGGAGGPSAVLPGREAASRQGAVLTQIVAAGDSLTAGYQADGFLGATSVKNPLYPGKHVHPSQENGWWALLDEQASSKPLETAIAQIYDPSISPLPLIQGPGLDNQIVPAGPSPFFPFGQLKTGDVCTDNHGFNQAGYLFRGSTRVRMNPTSTTIRNVGVPGITLHEANVIHQPQTTTCSPLPGIPGLLSDVVAEESGTFWPVLRNFTNLGPHLTEVNAAASRHPTLATIWLGANDVLKYMGSGGRFVGGDRNAGQAESDLRAAIGTLQHAGARVVVANLPSILETGFFQRVTIPKRLADCKIATYAYCLIAQQGFSTNVVSELAKRYHLATPQGCKPTSLSKPCGYLTLPGVVEVISYHSTTGQIPNLDCAKPAPHCKSVPGSGLGMNYITPEFAGKVQSLNNAVNTGIDDAARSSRVPLVDVTAIFDGLASGDPANPYFAEAASINPGKCCTLGFLYGILSFDGLHPSNTGYALIAYDFIKTINKAYGTQIPEVDVQAVYSGTRCSNKQYCFPDPYAPPNDIP